MGEASATRLEGDRYQHLYSWYELLRLLDEASPFDYATIEHPEAGAADDVTFQARPGSQVPSRFVQVKWHVDHRGSYSFDGLVSAKPGERSLLGKLFDSWRALLSKGPAEVWLVSNWAPAPHPDIGQYIDGRTYQLLNDFFTGGERSSAAKTRAAWCRSIGASAAELESFCRDLRLQLGFSSISSLEEQVDDRMARYGLRLGKDARAIARDEIAERIEVGGNRKRLSRAELLATIERRGLRAQHPEEPTGRLWIHCWARQAWDRPPDAELDWSAHFNRETRSIPAADLWASRLLPELRQARDTLAGLNAKYIDFRGKAPLSAMLTIGASFPQVGGFRFRAEQPTGGEILLWRSDARPSSRRFLIKFEDVQPGPNLAVGLGVTGDGLPDLKLARAAFGAGALIYAEPDTGAGPSALTSSGDAVALAASAKALIRDARAKHGAAKIHLVPYGPASPFLFLGQHLNALGPICLYERSPDGGYQLSHCLNTG